MTEITLTTEEINELKAFNIGTVENNVLTISDTELGEMYDVLIPLAENPIIFNMVTKILKNAPDNIIKPISIN